MTAAPEVTVEALEALGARRLAEILLDHGDRDEALAQTLRLATAGAGSPDRFARTLSAEIDRIARDDRFIGYRASYDFARDLDRVRASIVQDLQPGHPRAAADLLSRFVRLDRAVFERVDDSGGTVGDVFRQAVEDYGSAWAAVPDRDRAALAAEVLAILTKDDYGVLGGVVVAFKEALGPDGLDALERLIRAELDHRRAKGGQTREWDLTRGLHDIADARGDVDAYIAAQRAAGREENALAEIVRRLLKAGRPEDAVRRIETDAVPDHRRWEIAALHIEALDKLGRGDDAQLERWREFERGLDHSLLNDYLTHLPETDRPGATAKAVETALVHPNVHAALSLLAKLDVEAAARLVLARQDRMSGDAYTTLRAAVKTLASRHPVAAIVLYRRLADAVLAKGQSAYYEHAVRDLAAAERLAPDVTDWLGQPLHEDYRREIAVRHRNKSAFWTVMDRAGLAWRTSRARHA